jgi:transposase
MNLHLAEISQMVSPGKHAVLLLDQAGWHLSGDFTLPPDSTLLPLPPKCPERNVMENIWQFIRENWLSNRGFHDHDEIVDHRCLGWNRPIDQPWHITSIALPHRAHQFRSVGFGIMRPVRGRACGLWFSPFLVALGVGIGRASERPRCLGCSGQAADRVLPSQAAALMSVAVRRRL